MTPTTTRLDELLHDALAFGDGTRNGLANHLPMALVALERLGARHEHLQAHFDRYAARWSVPRTDGPAVEELRDEIFADGIDTVVRRRLPTLADGPGTQWFHAMIRLAFAIDARHEGQVAAALLDWERDLLVLGSEPAAGGTTPFADVIRAVPPLGGGAWRLADAARSPEVSAALDGADLALDQQAAAVVALHVAGGAQDIGTLHLLTGVHAARVVAPLLDARTAGRLARRTGQAVVAGAAGSAMALPEDAWLDELRAGRVATWEAIAAGAATTHDPHVAKVVYSCRAEQAATGDVLYQWVAARAVGLT